MIVHYIPEKLSTEKRQKRHGARHFSNKNGEKASADTIKENIGRNVFGIFYLRLSKSDKAFGQNLLK